MGQGTGKVIKPKFKKFKKKGSTKVTQVADDDRKEKKANKCHFCKKKGHYQKYCLKRKTWLKKKGIFYYDFPIFESNVFEVPSNTRWLDSGATTHVSNVMQGLLTI